MVHAGKLEWHSRGPGFDSPWLHHINQGLSWKRLGSWSFWVTVWVTIRPDLLYIPLAGQASEIGPVAGAERQRRYKIRLRRGAVIVPVEVGPLDGEALVDCGLLSWCEVDDRDAILRAFRDWLDGLRATG